MQTQLHAVINEEGTYNGFSANYSGSGFSRMNFAFHGLTEQGFDQWVAKVKAEGTALDRAAYLELEKPSEQAPVQYFSSVENGLYHAILNMCADPARCVQTKCITSTPWAAPARKATRTASACEYDNLRMEEGHEAPAATTPASGRPSRGGGVQPEGMMPREAAPEVNQPSGPDAHQGHAVPGAPGGPASGAVEQQVNQTTAPAISINRNGRIACSRILISSRSSSGG